MKARLLCVRNCLCVIAGLLGSAGPAVAIPLLSDPYNYHVGDYPRCVAAGDLNGDDCLDLAVANQESNDVSVLMNNGDGTFAAAMYYDVGRDPWCVAIGDLNGDEWLDLAVANVSSSNVTVLLNQSGWLPGDVDGDGDVDLADLAALLAAYRACEGDPNYDPYADFDNNGCVDLADLEILLANYRVGT